MDIDAGPDDGSFEDERERVDRPMARLFADYGRDHAGSFAVGLVSSVLSRVLDLLSPLLLAVAIDAIFNPEMGFRLWLVPGAWLPEARTAQLWLTAGLIAATFVFAAGFHYSRMGVEPLWSSSSGRPAGAPGPTPTTENDYTGG